MNEMILTTGRDTLLFGIPKILHMLIGLFRLDELFFRPKKKLKRPHMSCQMDDKGERVLSDPDGRRSRAHTRAGNQVGSGRQRSLVPEPADPPQGEQKPARLRSSSH